MLLRMRRNRALTWIYKQIPVSIRRRSGASLWEKAYQLERFPKLPAIVRSSDAPQVESVLAPSRGVGINLFGFLGVQFGLGESARLYARAFSDHGVDVVVNDLAVDLPHAKTSYDLPRCTTGEPRHSTDLICANPDIWSQIKDAIPERKPGRVRVGSWFWELEDLPANWVEVIDDFDAIMVATSFVEQALLKITKKPVLHIPLPLYLGPDSGISRSHFGLPEDKFIFLASFDFYSSMMRKNPIAAIRAFQTAFNGGEDNVRLLIKTNHGDMMRDDLGTLFDAAGRDRRILIRDGSIASENWRALQRCCDAYVSLHRAEGFGLGLAECMALAKPVIATAWSGNMDFMDMESALLVNAERVPVRSGEYFYTGGSFWAEPDVDQAAEHMRWLANHPAEGRELGIRAKKTVEERLDPARIAGLFANALTTLERRNARDSHYGYGTC